MFVSLNRKILYTIGIFFILTCSIFVYAFYIVYGEKFQEEGQINLLNTKQFSEMNYENVILRQELNSIIKSQDIKNISPNAADILRLNKEVRSINEITSEHRRVEDIINNYNSRYNSFARAIKVTLISTVLIILLIIILGVLLKTWILEPINKLSQISDLAASGDLSQRVKLNKDYMFADEIDKLAEAFNQMLENLNNSFNEIKQKEQFQQALINSIPDGIRVIDKNYNIILANDTYYKQINATPSTELSKCYASCQKLEHPCPENLFTCPLKEIKEKKQNQVKVIQQFAAFPGRHLSINAAPLLLDDSTHGSAIYIVESIRDLSNDIKFSHQQKISSLGFLSTSVAHEMKNHLGSIRMIMENILEKNFANIPNEDETKKYLQMVQNQIIQCINVPERLLKLSRNVSDNSGPVNCYTSTSEILALLDYEAKRKGIELKFSKPRENIQILGNDSDYKMIMLNLLQNAIKAIEDTGEISISIKTDEENQAVIKIKDNGIGIPAQHLSHIFEPFYSEGKKDNQSGTGLGLAIVKSIVEKFHGSISVKSTEGKGTTFTLKFPLYDNKTAKA